MFWITNRDYKYAGKTHTKSHVLDAGYWENAAQGVLSAQRCQQCGFLQLYPRPVCVNCFSRELGWEKLSGKGKVHSFTTVEAPANPAFKDDAPLIFAEIELEEGIRMHAGLVRCAPENVSNGAAVQAVFEPTAEESIRLPNFELV